MQYHPIQFRGIKWDIMGICHIHNQPYLIYEPTIKNLWSCRRVARLGGFGVSALGFHRNTYLVVCIYFSTLYFFVSFLLLLLVIIINYYYLLYLYIYLITVCLYILLYYYYIILTIIIFIIIIIYIYIISW